MRYLTGHAVFHALALLVVLCCRNITAAPPLPDFVIDSWYCSRQPQLPDCRSRSRPPSATGRRKRRCPEPRRLAQPHQRHSPSWEEVEICGVGRTTGTGESRVVTPLPQRFLAAGTNRLCAWVEFENLVAETCNTNNHFCMDYYAESELALLRAVPLLVAGQGAPLLHDQRGGEERVIAKLRSTGPTRVAFAFPSTGGAY